MWGLWTKTGCRCGGGGFPSRLGGTPELWRIWKRDEMTRDAGVGLRLWRRGGEHRLEMERWEPMGSRLMYPESLAH